MSDPVIEHWPNYEILEGHTYVSRQDAEARLRELRAERARLSEERDQLKARVAELEALVRDVANSDFEFGDPRIDYVTVQIDRHTWAEVRNVWRGRLTVQIDRHTWAEVRNV